MEFKEYIMPEEVRAIVRFFKEFKTAHLLETCKAGGCVQSGKLVRYTPEGPYCFEHYIELPRCGMPGCINPAGTWMWKPKKVSRVKVCRDCLNRGEQVDEQHEEMLLRLASGQSNMCRLTEADSF